jgi:transcriptional regulator with XRE-family HTH domain
MNFPRRKKQPVGQATVDANQIVGVNFRLAREMRGWTQEEAATRLSTLNDGVVLPKASISAIERGIERDRRRVFDAQELVKYALLFEVPIFWFFLPVEETRGRALENWGYQAEEMMQLFVGTDAQLAEVREHLRTVRPWLAGRNNSAMLEDLSGVPSWGHFEQTRQVLLAEFAKENKSALTNIFREMQNMVNRVGALLSTYPGKGDFDKLATMEYVPLSTYRRTSEVLLGRSAFEIASCESQTLPDFFMREDLAIEDWVDFTDPALRAPLQQFFKGLEAQLKKKSIAPSPDA